MKNPVNTLQSTVDTFLKSNNIKSVNDFNSFVKSHLTSSTMISSSTSKITKTPGSRNRLLIPVSETRTAGFSPLDRVYASYGKKSVKIQKTGASTDSTYKVDSNGNIRIPVNNLGESFVISSSTSKITVAAK